MNNATLYFDNGCVFSSSSQIQLQYLYQHHRSCFNGYHFGARCYDPGTGGWLSTDKMSQYFNSYQFVGADPINYRDLDGNFGWLTHTAVGLLEGHSYYEALGDWYRETNFLIEENDGIRWLAGKVHTVYKSEMEKFQTLSVEELNKKSGLNLSEAEWDGIKSHAKHDWYHEREHETYSPIESFVHTQFGPEAGSWYQDIEDVGVLGGIGFYTLYPLVQPLIDLVLPLTGLPQGSLPAIVTPIFGIIAMDQAISIIGIVNKDYRGETYIDYGQM